MHNKLKKGDWLRSGEFYIHIIYTYYDIDSSKTIVHCIFYSAGDYDLLPFDGRSVNIDSPLFCRYKKLRKSEYPRETRHGLICRD